MKVFVTGASGFTGSHLVKALESRGDQVVALVRKSSQLARLEQTSARLVYGDITNRQVLAEAMAGVDVIFHVAAYVDLGLVNEAEMERVNVGGTQAVLAAAQAEAAQRDTPLRLVYCSTIGVFGDTAGQVVDESYRRSQTTFSSAYDRTKLQAQQQVDQANGDGLETVSLLPAGILGADDPHFGPVLRLFLQRRLKLWPGGDRITGVVHVDDLVEAMLLAASQGTAGEHYIVSAGELSTRRMFEILSRETGIPVPGEPPRLLVRLLGNLLDPIGRVLGWNPPLSRERVHYIYDRCVRVKADKLKQLGWQPQPVEEMLRDIVEAMEQQA
ncbi:NAD-dependent epimerase/dehydratase family protein [Romeria aff. gracilis LEGE 07310]|uniref:NAD-dependent epimerase/dehydratase family protein n=1 Tax=Vasconcelosia minhoensis LEGE 07310 TaxID=915328 RepID=A0A8J7DBC7_9CYAN|nr:NAD-dependent epimerase/dehydratase family protein [Romeria gracilis]MBE9076223.1 NAD-dependent epimerase/dehydratase family protein [Romeria aff. gracilis LEGE 07310]